MKTSLQLKFSQHLALTPQLQQSIRLLQLSTLELNQELDQVLADNPLLERLDDPLAPSIHLDASGAAADRFEAAPTSASPAESTAEASSPDTFDEDASAHDDDGLWDTGRREGGVPDDDPVPQQVAATGLSLRDHLMAQLAGTRATPIDRALVAILIDNLDDDGRLDAAPDEIAALLPEALEIPPEALETALKLLQSFDPPGVGARSLEECLLLQLAALGQGAAAPEADTLGIARTIVAQHLPLLAGRDFTRLRRALKCDDAQLRAAQTLIRSLSPRPGARFSTEASGYVTPDVIARRTRSGWQATLNPEAMPRLRINEAYARILKQERTGGDLSARLQEARWLVKNIQQRYDTILRVSQAIVERQKAFLSHGAVAMRPLVLREIADELGLHESTISRVTTAKYMLTPHGTLELKYFFGSHVATDSGGAASSTAIRALIRQLIEAEDVKHPLSDGRIAELLGEQGFVVARRTVAKYRETSNIPPVAQRKSL